MKGSATQAMLGLLAGFASPLQIEADALRRELERTRQYLDSAERWLGEITSNCKQIFLQLEDEDGAFLTEAVAQVADGDHGAG